MVTETSKLTEKFQAGWSLHLGLTIFVVGFASPLLIPLVTASDLPTRWKAIISGALAVGIPEVFSIAAIAIMGKSGFNYIKTRVFSFIKKHGPPDVVSRTRYRIGLILFGLPLLFAWLAPYIPQLFPGYNVQPLLINIIGDLMFVSSLFVLGGDFWDKVRSLFIHEARAQIPA
jgi:hypothetical protein